MDTANIIIRPERVSDYPEIAIVQARAFGNRFAEPLIVALLRQRRAFDQELSLVAECNGRIVGHALFSPYQMRLLDQTISIVNLAPIAVAPGYQGQGIGGQLITEGHRVAAAKGYKGSILLGHSSYYPRFGYHTYAFGIAQLSLSNANTTFHEALLEVRSPINEDGPLLYDLWRHEEEAVDMALEPGQDILDWLSPNPDVQATVYTHNNIIVGYTRVHIKESTKPRIFLARDHEAARAMVATMAHTLNSTEASVQYILPLHPSSASAQAFGDAIATVTPKSAAMACPLIPSPLNDYLALTQSGQRPPGRIIWPVVFDFD